MVGSVDTGVENDMISASFWQCREYQRTVKRVEASNKLCSELSMMIQERAELEKAYSANLKRWSARWLSFLDSGLEYASGTYPWRGLCREAESIANAHQSVKNILMEEIQNGLKHWQKEHFHKNPLPPQTLKESKLFEQDFEQAQKPWAKRLKKMQHCKKDYHSACRMEKSLQVQVQNAKNDPAGTPEQLKKIQEKLTKAEKEVERTRFVYNNSLNDLDSENPRYLEEMTKVFNRAQEFERDRLVYFKSVFSNVHQALNVALKVDFDAVYNDLQQAIDHCEVEGNLAWWSSHHGVDMPAVLPQFEEYLPELNTISNKKRSQVSDVNSGVTLTGISTNISSPQPVNPPANGSKPPISTPFDDLTPSPKEKISEPFSEITAEAASATETVNDVVTASVNDTAPVTDEMSDADYFASATYDDGRPGVQIRALYDYIGQEEDELTFAAGDEFEKLEEADDQGWCKGRKDGRCGLYPANYADAI